MNEKLDLCEILKGCPKGTKLWSPIFGEMDFMDVTDEFDHPIDVQTLNTEKEICIASFAQDGRYSKYFDGECLLFPSKENRDWSTFRAPKPEPKYQFKPFDKVLVRDCPGGIWVATFYSHYYGDKNKAFPHMCVNGAFGQCLPFAGNEHLLGTTDEPKE